MAGMGLGLESVVGLKLVLELDVFLLHLLYFHRKLLHKLLKLILSTLLEYFV